MIEVVIPCYNGAQFLHETLASVAGQSVPPGIVTVVDDSSTDDSVAVAAGAAGAFADRITVRLLHNPGPRGPSAARNFAIRQSTAEHIALLDADDLFEPDHHVKLLGVLAAHPDTVLAFGDTMVFSGTQTVQPSLLRLGGVLDLPATEVAQGCWVPDDGVFAPLLRTGIFGTSACLFRRQTALAAGLFDETMMHGEDTDLFLRMALLGPFAYSRATVSRKRVHGNNLSDPRNRLAFCRGTALTLVKLASEQQAGCTARQRRQLEEYLVTALDGYLYHASLAGVSAYRRAAGLAYRAGQIGLAANPRHLARLALRRIL